MNQDVYINGRWDVGAGAAVASRDPGNGEAVYQGRGASVGQVAAAVGAALAAGREWSRKTTEQRAGYVGQFAAALKIQNGEMLEAICRETGKPRWEAQTECDALVGKVALTQTALAQRQSPVASSKEGVTAATRYKPLGVAAVLGPFNLPAHLPNGQIIPALLAGNTVVFKPSEMTPLVGAIYAGVWEAAGIPPGVFNMVQGGREVGAALAGDARIDAVLFTGSRAGGVALAKMLADHPEKMLTLEMGGNNPLIAVQVENVDAAAYAIIQSAFITAGQRCTCARRLILMRDAEGDRILQRLIAMTRTIRVGHYRETPEPFMGPVISSSAALRLQEAVGKLLELGAAELLPLHSLGHALLSPAIIDVTAQRDRRDEELFGPILQVVRVDTFEAALVEANRTAYGLAAGLLSADRGLYERFFAEIRAGIVNWNRPTTGASGALPFGGIGASGNHRPAGAFAIDFCADPVASLESESLVMPAKLSPGITLP